MVDGKENCVMTDQFNRIQGAVLKTQHRNYSIYKGVNTIGRNKSATINLKNLNVSQNHAVIIIVDDTQHFISDLNSSNGTYLTGTKLSPFKLYELVNDVEIKFGDVSVSYSRVSNTDTTIYLQMASIDMTQNMTQNFYEAGTQLMINESSLNHTANSIAHRFCSNDNVIHKIPRQVPTTSATVRDVPVDNSKSNSSVNEKLQEVDIHEMSTQVVDLPEELKMQEKESMDIHELPTQVVDLPEEFKKPKEQNELDIHEMPTQVVDLPEDFESSEKLQNENLHEMPTQVVNVVQEFESSERSSNASTQVDEDICKSEDLNQANRKANSDMETTELFMQNTSNIGNIEESVIEETVIDETHLEKEIDENSSDSIDFLAIQKPIGNERTTPTKEPNSSNTSIYSASQDVGIRRKRPARKLSSSEELSQIQNGKTFCHSDSDTDIENEIAISSNMNKQNTNVNTPNYSASQNIGIRRKRRARKLSSSEEISQIQNGKPVCNSDSETDIENEISIPSTMNKPKLPSEDTKVSDSDTEIEEDLPQQSKNFILNSDSETDIEEHVSYQEILSQSQKIKPKILNKKRILDSDSETDIEDVKEKEAVLEKIHEENSDILNDTDFIPATQDAFANMYAYKNSKLTTSNANSQNESSEESFKLGLTELMAESMESKKEDSINEESKTNNVTNEENTNDVKSRDNDQLKNNEGPVPSDNVQEEGPVSNIIENKAGANLHTEPPQAIHTANFKEDSNQQHIHSIATNANQSTSDVSKVKETKISEDDLYMMPTQKLNEKEIDTEQTQAKVNTEADDDFYMMPTQKHTQNNNQPEFKTPKKMYTFKKKVVTLDESLSTILGKKQDDPYSAPTQKMVEEEDKSDNIYLEPTQKLNEETKLHDMYLQPTQDLNLVTNTEEDLYMAPTQQINVIVENNNTAQDKTVANSLLQENQHISLTTETMPKEAEKSKEDMYMAETQPMPCLQVEKNDKISPVISVANLYLQDTQDLDLMKNMESNKKIEDANLKEKNENCQVGSDSTVGSVQKTSEKIDEDPYFAMTQPINSIILDNKVDKNPFKKPITDLYLQETEEIGIKNFEGNKDEKDKDPYMIATQQINQNSVEEGSSTKDHSAEISSRTKRHMQPDIKTSKLNKKRKLTDDEVEKLVDDTSNKNPLTTLKNPSEIEGETFTKISKVKPENKAIDQSETLSQIQRFVSETSHYSIRSKVKTLPEKKSSTEPQIEAQSETISQIEAFVKKPLSTIKENIDTPLKQKVGTRSKKQKIDTSSEKQKSDTPSKKQKIDKVSNQVEQLDEEFQKPDTSLKKHKIDASSKKQKTDTPSKKQKIDKVSDKVAESDEEFQKPERCTRSRRTTSSNLSKTHVSKEECESLNKFEPDASTSSDNSDSTTAKSDVEKSFALLEAKSTKTRKSQRVVNSAEVKVAVCKNRRSMATSAMPENTSMFSSPEKGKRKQKPKVVFTMLDSPLLESLIKHLGGSVVDNVDSSTALVTEQVKRSQKLLTAVGQAKPICSPEWIRASKKANEFLDPWNYILIDEEAESKWNFSLRESLMRSSNKKLLNNYTFQIIVNNAEDVLKGAIKACGGKCVPRCPAKNVNEFFIVVASPENKSKYVKIRQQHPQVIIVEPEAIFDGVLRQELRFDKHILI